VARAIYLRRSSQAEAEFRVRGILVEWQTQQLARVIASTVPVPKGKKNPLESLVRSISLFDDTGSETVKTRTEDTNIYEDSPSLPTPSTDSSTAAASHADPGGPDVKYNSFESVQRLFRMRNARIDRPRESDLEAQARWARERESDG
jgi:hypothetical protein